MIRFSKVQPKSVFFPLISNTKMNNEKHPQRTTGFGFSTEIGKLQTPNSKPNKPQAQTLLVIRKPKTRNETRPQTLLAPFLKEFR